MTKRYTYEDIVLQLQIVTQRLNKIEWLLELASNDHGQIRSHLLSAIDRAPQTFTRADNEQ